MNLPVIRHAQRSDISALLSIYNHYIVNTHVTFHIEPLTLDQRTVWFEQFSQAGCYQCLIAALNGETIGWACSTPFKERAAYETSVETSVYLAPDLTGRGIGKSLYRGLLTALEAADVHRAYGFVSQPNPASGLLHERTGFSKVGTFGEVGRKFGRFWDVAVYERPMNSGLATPAAP